MNKNRLIAWTPILLLVALAGLTFWLDRAVQTGGVQGPRNASDPDIVVEDFSAMQFNLDGSRRYSLIAHRMTHRPDEDSTQLETPELTHYEPGKAEVHVRSNLADVSKDAELVIFSGEVTVRRDAEKDSGPITILTSHLEVVPKQDFARSDREVTIVTDHGTLKGVGLEFNNRTRQMKMHSQVHGEFRNPRATQTTAGEK
jgi:lipopolysaccharide export system protein LptC